MIRFFLLLLLLFWRASIIIWKWIPNEKKTHRNNNKNQKIAVRDHTLASLLGRLFRMYIFVCIGKMKKKKRWTIFLWMIFRLFINRKKSSTSVPRRHANDRWFISHFVNFHTICIRRRSARKKMTNFPIRPVFMVCFFCFSWIWFHWQKQVHRHTHSNHTHLGSFIHCSSRKLAEKKRFICIVCLAKHHPRTLLLTHARNYTHFTVKFLVCGNQSMSIYTHL